MIRIPVAVRGVAALAVLAASTMFAGSASAATLTVTNANDSGARPCVPRSVLRRMATR